ncbi:hypothetical protein ACWPMX_01540 [Tsuneonella sp. HG094]
MTIRFAAARSAVHSPIARALARRAHGRATNDNGDDVIANEAVFHAALRHFAAHGVGAARVALGEADKAQAEGDAQGHDWWMEICRTLDRRIAAGAMRRD